MRTLPKIRRNDAGFSLIELTIAAAIVGVLSTLMVLSFSKNRVDLNREASLIAANIRRAQAMAVAGRTHPVYGTSRCGYGIRRKGNTAYAIYSGPNANIINCDTDDRQYNPGNASCNSIYPAADCDDDVETITLSNSQITFQGQPFQDIFFEPPDPRTYLCESGCMQGGNCFKECALPFAEPGIVTIKITDGTKTKDINVYSSGQVEIQ